MLKQLLARFLPPSFFIEQEFPTVLGVTRTLCIDYSRGMGYAVFETRTERGETGIDPDAFEEGLTRAQARRAAEMYGARRETLEAFDGSVSLSVAAPPPLQLQLHASEEVLTFTLQDHTSRAGFLATLCPALERHRCDPLLALVGQMGEREVAWQELFDFIPWGTGVAGDIHWLATRS